MHLRRLVLAALVVSLLAPHTAAATPTVIRVGGPSASGDAKVAIVASERDLGGRHFAVLRGGRVVLRGRLRPAPGSSRPWAHAYRADLSRLRRAGSYRVRAAGVRSRPWKVRRKGSAYLIPLLLKFFRTNRDGNEPALLHGPAHLNDAVIEGGPHDGEHVDLVGGWMDAGDMIHFTQTTAYASVALQAAARLGVGAGPALKAEADVGVRWLQRAHPFPDVFVTQVGGEVDHSAGFRDPARDDSSSRAEISERRAYHWASQVGADLAGKVAAAFAMAARRVGTAGPAGQALIAQARSWYAGGQASREASPVLPGTGGFYVYDTWRGSMAAGAAALHRVTGEQHFLDEAVAFLEAADDERYAALDASSMAAIAAADICGALGLRSRADEGVQAFACRYLRDGASTTLDYRRQNAFAPASYFQWGTTGVNCSLGAQAALAHRAGRFRQGRRVAAGARDWLLGRNPWGASFVAGFGPRSPRKIHHWASVFAPHDGLPKGSVVGGPAPRSQVRAEGFRADGPLRRFNSDIVYEDERNDYVTSEPAIDYVANCILLLAALPR